MAGKGRQRPAVPAEVRAEDLFSAALGLEAPWRVTGVSFEGEPRRLDIQLAFATGAHFACPECGAQGLGVYDAAERTWRHLDFFQHQCHLHARLPRVQCAACGVRTVSVPWARPGSGFTLLGEPRAQDGELLDVVAQSNKDDHQRGVSGDRRLRDREAAGWPPTKNRRLRVFTQEPTTPRPPPGQRHPSQAKPRLHATLSTSPYTDVRQGRLSRPEDVLRSAAGMARRSRPRAPLKGLVPPGRLVTPETHHIWLCGEPGDGSWTWMP